ncbi:AsnC family protein [Metabacillus fastidiosus]|uniref:AsnC family protein n=1 Tax=Metabacillus fastidiosus TaxID=1458 RepID=UPI002E1A6883|nr:AsnC family protein [Metabacillus fastidiosus]
MEFLMPILDNQETFIDEWHECYVSDSKITGFICTFQLSNKKHHFYGLNDIENLLLVAKKKKKDVYLSLNAFEYGSRTAQSLRQIRNIGVDIDCYKLNISVTEAIEEVKKLIFAARIPNPNLLIHSGRGIQLIYSISGGASPKMAFLSQYITTQFISELKHIGADTSGTDVTRVFRLPYSVNSKNNKQVTVDLWRSLEYSLQELYSYCTPLEQRRKPSKKQKGTLVTLPSKVGLKNLYSLNTARKSDLELLVTLRHGDIEKRNVLTYIYAYTVALILKNKEATIEFARQLDSRFIDPQKVKKLVETAGNAYDDAMIFFEEFKKRDFTMWYKTADGIKRPMKNVTIIEELEVTQEEMQQLTTIINADVKYQRKVEKRREQGIQEREQYIKEQYNKTDDKLFKLQELLEENPKRKKTELARLLGISRVHLYRLLKQI